MNTTILTVEVRKEQDVVLARQRSRQIAGLLGFDTQEQTRIATAVSEISRNAFQYGGGGKVEFLVEGSSPQVFSIRIRDRGSGIADLKTILDGRYTSATGMGLGIIGARRLMDQFHIESSPGNGTTVLLGKHFPKRIPAVTPQRLGQIAQELARQASENPYQELQQQNQEILRTLEELRQRSSELAQLNSELEDTNRGVVALYAELDDRAEYLQRASELKTRFLSNMTHEFRTPLNAILSLSQMLLDRIDGELTSEQEKQVSFIRKSALELSELVNDLLDLAKVEAGKVTVRPNEFEVIDLFNALKGVLRPLLAQNSSVNLVFEEPISFPTLYTDEGKVSQILRNLISNALKFTPTGEVRVSVQMGRDRTVVFSVADTGIGIRPEDQERIFEEFAQVENPIQKHVKGTGLGLPLCRQLARLLGGSISVKSELGVGSTFFATLPIIYSEPGEVEAPKVSPLIDPNHASVLVVEDNPETLFVYEKYLQGSGFQVIGALSLAEARQWLRQVKPVAVVLDILLRKESAWSLLGELKSNSATRDIPVLVVTIVDNQEKAIALGADAFCLKPVDRNWLLNQLKTLTGQGTTAKILIIDDDEISRYLLKGLLSDMPYTLLEEGNGREGIRRAIEEQPQVIFLDLLMPGITGLEVLEQLKSNPATKDIPIVINTSKNLEEAERQRLAADTVAIVSKETPSRTVAIALIREALKKAGLNPVSH